MLALATSFSSIVANSLHSVIQLSWTLQDARVVAHFTLDEIAVEISFEPRSAGEWLVAFDVIRGRGSDIYAAFQIFNGVFQAVEEFIETRQPLTVVFAAKRPALAEIYETYLKRESKRLEQLGYALDEVGRIPPFSEYILRRTLPSEWVSG